MSITDDIARIGWVIENYDTVELIIEDGKQSHSKGFADKNNNPAPQIKYSKKINGTYYVVEAAFENRYNKLWVQSAYLGKNREDVTQVPDAAVKPPEVTARADLPSPSSKISLSQDRKNVNKDYSKEQAISQGGVASFVSKDSGIKAVPKITEEDGMRTISATKSIDDKAFIDGLWDGAEYTTKNNVEKSQLESVENFSDDDIIEETRVLTLDSLTKDVLKTKPLYSPTPDKWIKKGGKIEIDYDGDWVYTNADGISVKYVDGYPDFKGAGLVIQEVDIGEFVNRGVDKKKAKELVEQNPNTEWHHPPNSNILQEINADIHKQFTHIGGIATNRNGE